MLQNSFCHVPGCGSKFESKLWAAGVHSWDHVATAKTLPMSLGRAKVLREHISASRRALVAGDAGYFTKLLPSDCAWRLFPEFRSTAAYLDIETTGLDGPKDYITTIVLYDGVQARHYIQSHNLVDFGRDIVRFNLIITFNGTLFDLPFIRSRLGVDMDQAHIDLRYVLSSLGIDGGLKSAETKLLGRDRGPLAGIDGLFAMGLWLDYLRGNEKALDTLLAYNEADAVNLERLMVAAYNRKIEHTPFHESNRLSLEILNCNSQFKPHAPTVARLRRRYSTG